MCSLSWKSQLLEYTYVKTTNHRGIQESGKKYIGQILAVMFVTS